MSTEGGKNHMICAIVAKKAHIQAGTEDATREGKNHVICAVVAKKIAHIWVGIMDVGDLEVEGQTTFESQARSYNLQGSWVKAMN